MACKWLGSLCTLAYFRSLFQGGGMREIDLGAHTIKSHGARVARHHMHDWIILVLLAIIEGILFMTHPFYRYVGKDMMTDLKYPMKDNSVPVWAVPLYAVLLPIAIFLLIYVRRRCVYDLHHAILGLLYAVLITGVITDAVKNAVGRPRPNFFWRCFPDGKEKFDTWGGVICHGDAREIKEGHKSFPSGHTSWSFAGLGYLSLYLSGKIQAFDGKGHVAKLCVVLLPLVVATLVGVSRVNDYWHHWQDVFAGALLGLVVAALCYRQSFPPPYNDDGWGPYAYFREREESISSARANANVTQPMSTLDSHSMQIVEYHNHNHNHNGNGATVDRFPSSANGDNPFMGVYGDSDDSTSSRPDHMESGRK